MSERVFVDTNVFVYADDAKAKSKQQRARVALAPLIRERRAVISTQIMQEYFSSAVKKLHLPLERARTRVENLARLDVIVIRPELILGAIDLHRLHKVSFWDALVIKSASAGGCARLLTEDLNDGQVIDGVKIDNPF
jgi:predicted nucleic acid-binding protein